VFAQINGIRLSYNDHGSREGNAVVFLHGFPFNQSMWSDQVGLLKERFRVITYDHRGLGESGIGDGQFTLEFLVDDLIALLDHLNIQKAILCGLSMGGYVALRAVERNPERIQALVLCDTRSEADSNLAKIGRSSSINIIKNEGLSKFSESFLVNIFAAASLRNHPDRVERVRRMILDNNPLGVCGMLLALASRTNTTSALPQVRIPTLVLVGEKDTITPPSAAENLKFHIPLAQMAVIPNAAHMSNIENPDLFNQHLTHFLESIHTA
jgi:3-oxoadipate enol-lactonase